MYYYRTADGRSLTSQSQGHRLREIRALYRWLVRTRLIEVSAAESLELPRNEYRLPKTILPIEEFESILAACDLKSPMGIRDRALLEVLYATGIRRFAMLRSGTSISRTHDDGAARQRKEGPYPDRRTCRALVQKYLDEVRPMFAMESDKDFVFLTRWREAFSTERVSEIIREVVAAPGIASQRRCICSGTRWRKLMLEVADIRYI